MKRQEIEVIIVWGDAAREDAERYVFGSLEERSAFLEGITAAADGCERAGGWQQFEEIDPNDPNQE